MSRQAGGFGTPREQAGSLTMPQPPPTTTTAPVSADKNAENEVRQCGGNVVLMEARLCEIASSLRALARSNVDLEAALDDDAPDDPDFLQAVSENKLAIKRQGQVTKALVREMKFLGTTNVDLEEDVRDVIDSVQCFGVAEKDGQAGSTDTASGLYL
eukprot:scaffold742_cov165-Amphora_coffeaeformis.AAC.20